MRITAKINKINLKFLMNIKLKILRRMKCIKILVFHKQITKDNLQKHTKNIETNGKVSAIKIIKIVIILENKLITYRMDKK